MMRDDVGSAGSSEASGAARSPKNDERGADVADVDVPVGGATSATAGLPTAPVWTGDWVASRLDAELSTVEALPGIGAHDLVGMAVRRNPRRAHLLVSNVLGKHLPVDPAIVRGSGLVLGELVRRVLVGGDAGGAGESAGAGDAGAGSGPSSGPAAAVGPALHAALSSPEDRRMVDEFTSAVARFVNRDDSPACLVMGFAETATALGQCVADALRAPAIHSTRRPVAGFEPVGAFEEEHSHATSHLVLPSDAGFFERTHDGDMVPLVLVDDELSTGRTALNTIEALHASVPRAHYVIATLIDMRSDDDRTAMQNRADDLGVRLDVVALAAGRLDLPEDVLDRGRALVAQVEANGERATGAPGSGQGVKAHLARGVRGVAAVVSRTHLESPLVVDQPAADDARDAAASGQARSVLGSPSDASASPGSTSSPARVVHVDVPWPARTPLTGRHGVTPAQLAPVAGTWARATSTGEGAVGDGLTGEGVVGEVLAAAAASVIAQLPDDACDGQVLVLGTEELMDAPLRLATALRTHGLTVRFSTTTRSPVLAENDPGYAIRSALTFAAFDHPADGPGPRFTYNVSRETPWSAIVLCVDPPCDDAVMGEPGGVLDQLGTCAATVVVARLPEMPTRPTRELRGPMFGSYAADEVTWLLKDLSDVTLEAPTEEREEAIQSGGAHYAESLPVEFQPDAAYSELFVDALETTKTRVAQAVAAVTELVLAQRGDDVVLVSLARAGTPVGLLMKRWARHAHGLDLPHYAVSIVRGRGIDTAALDHITARHDASRVLFVDGWTGKGAITRELAGALDEYEAATGVPLDPTLAVLADTGSCTTMWGTRDDFLIPSACLNSTVSGLVSRTVLNDDLIGPGEFHGAKFYADLAPYDVSKLFVDTVTDAFPEPAEATRIRREAQARCAAEPPVWTGWAIVERLSDEYGIHSVNLVKPGVGETTRVLLRRVPWKILVAPGAQAELRHIEALAQARGVPIEVHRGLPYSCVGLIHPRFTRGATGDDGLAAGAADGAASGSGASMGSGASTGGVEPSGGDGDGRAPTSASASQGEVSRETDPREDRIEAGEGSSA